MTASGEDSRQDATAIGAKTVGPGRESLTVADAAAIVAEAAVLVAGAAEGEGDEPADDERHWKINGHSEQSNDLHETETAF